MSVSTNSIKMNNMVTSNEAKEENHMEDKKVVFDTRELNLWYGEDQALKNINLEILQNEVTAIIGPSGCGKSTYIKTLNRMIELIPSVRTSGNIMYRNKNILDKCIYEFNISILNIDFFSKFKKLRISVSGAR